MKTKEDTQKTSINKLLFFLHLTLTDSSIGYTNATSLSEPLKSNTTLTQLNLSGEDKRMTQIHPNHFYPFLFLSDNEVGDTGAMSLSEALKSNTTLVELNLSCETKRRRHAKDIQITFTLFSSYQITRLETQEQRH